tara:strand:+ start:51 stop:1538 length:1488 start_codon:yes stop_codon:yes gene_type:complete
MAHQIGHLPNENASKKELLDYQQRVKSFIDKNQGQIVPSDSANKFVENQNNKIFNNASNTDFKELDPKIGALAPFINQATQILDSVYASTSEPTQREKDINMGRAALQFFTQMGASASQPGQTALGAANIAGANVAKDYLAKETKREADKKALEQAKKSSALSLGMQLKSAKDAKEIALGKAKQGVPKVVEFGPAMENGEQKTDEKGNQLFTYNIYDPLGKIIETYDAPRKSGINIDVGNKSQQKFGEVFSTNQAKQFSTQLETSTSADEGMQTVDTLLNLLAQDDFETGPWEEFKLPLKTLGLSFGLFKNDDTTVDNIASAEAFRAKAYEIVLNSVSKMKGALSDKELGFLSAQGPTLSKTTEGNKLLLYLNKHQLNKASKFREFVISWSDTNNEGSFPQDGASYNKMISDWKKSDTMTQNPYQYIKNEAEKFEIDLIKNMGGEVDDKGDLVPGSLSNDTFQEQQKAKQIIDQVSKKFSLNMLKKVFKNSGFME